MKGKHAVLAANRKEYTALTERITHLERELAAERKAHHKATEDLRDLRAQADALRKQIAEDLTVLSEPRLAQMTETCNQLRTERDECRAEIEDLRAHYNKFFSRLISYIAAIDPAKPTKFQVFEALSMLAKNKVFTVRPDGVTTDDPELSRTIINIRQKQGFGRA